MRQCGLIATGSLLLYGGLAAGAVILGLTVALKVQSSRLDAAKEQFEACKATNAVLNEQINRQNEAVKALETEAQERQKRAQAALEAARKGQVKARTEIERLKAAKPPVKTDCPAGEAVKRVREGLR